MLIFVIIGGVNLVALVDLLVNKDQELNKIDNR